MGFTERFTYFPGVSRLQAIEGIKIIDLPAPGSIAGVGTGLVAIVAEFADMQYAVKVDASGNVSTSPRAVELFGTQDLLNKLGGWNSTIGEFGISGGNGFVDIRSRKFSRLAAVPVNLASAKAARAWRQLPTNVAADDATPIVPMAAVAVAAGREFKSGSNRVLLGTAALFTDDQAFAFGTDGTVTAVAASAGVVTSAAGPWDLRGAAAVAPMLRVVFNLGGNQDFTLTATAALVTGAGGAFAALGAETFQVQFESGPVQTITMGVEATIAAAIATINNQLFGGRCEAVDANNVKIISDVKGNTSRVRTFNVAAGITTKLGIANNADNSHGSDDVATLAAVTAAEWVTKLSTLTNGAASAVASALRLTSTTTGVGGSASVAAASTADTAMGFDNTVHSGAGAGTSVTNTFDSATGDFIVKNAKKGDMLVVGVIDGAGALGANADTYRVVSRTSATALVVEKLDGSAFSFTTTAVAPWRLHVAKTGDTGGNKRLSDVDGYTLPARPLDATIAAATPIAPTVAATAGTATTWDPLSGLKLQTDPATGLVYTAAIQAPNAPAHASIDALYSECFDALLVDDPPAREVNFVFSSRKSQTIRSLLKAHELAAGAVGMGRAAIISPDVDEDDLSTVLGDSNPGVGVNRDEALWYSWPGAQIFVPEAVGESIATSDGKTTDDGYIDVTMDSFLASVLSNLDPERNPGEMTDTVKQCMAPVLGFARGAPQLDVTAYKQLKAKGVVTLRFDRNAGPIFQSGVTTSLTDGKQTISRRRMAWFIQDSIAEALDPFSKLPLTDGLKKDIEGMARNFLEGLKSVTDPSRQRIQDYEVDPVSGNTAAMLAKGIFVLIIRVVSLATADEIVIQTEVGPNVVIVSGQ